MIIRCEYNTKQKQLILDFLKSNAGKHVTVDSVTEHLCGRVGRTTVYRYLESLASAGSLIKYDLPASGGTCYSFEGLPCKTFHFLCQGCGRVYHLDCGYLNEFSHHMQKDHGIDVDTFKTVIYGLCENCKNGEKSNA